MLLLSHNAYWFQGEPSLWGEEQIRAHPEVLDALVELYGQLEPDVICLQEVPTAAVASAAAAALEMDVAFAPGGIRTGYGGALLWRIPGASVTDLTQTINSRGQVFERIAMRLACPAGLGATGAGALSAVNAHLASNRFAPDGEGEAVRLAELEAALSQGPLPDLVAGDFNAVPASAVHAEMVSRGYVDARADGLSHGRAREHRIDYIWVRGDAGLSVVDHGVVTGEPFRVPDDASRELSDHHPIWARLEPAAGHHS